MQQILKALCILTLVLNTSACTAKKTLAPVSKPKTKTEKLVSNKFNLPTVLFFFAEWCGYCKKMEPHILKAEKEFKDKIFIYYVDIDSSEGRRMSRVYKTGGGVPHAQLYSKDGKFLDQVIGYTSYSQLEAKIKSNFGI